MFRHRMNPEFLKLALTQALEEGTRAKKKAAGLSRQPEVVKLFLQISFCPASRNMVSIVSCRKSSRTLECSSCSYTDNPWTF